MLFKVRSLASVVSVCLLALSAVPVMAAAPDNDDISNPVVVESIPYSNSQDTSEATTDPGDPVACFGSADAATVWYEFTPAESLRLEANTFGSDYDTTLYVGVADGGGGIDVIDCNDDSSSLQSRLRFDAEAGVSYLFAVGTCCGASGEPGGGFLVFNLDAAPPEVPLELSITLDQAGTFTKNGDATISGKLLCSGADFVEIYGSLRQEFGRFRIEGWGWDLLPCSGGEATWRLHLIGNGKFAGGPAIAYVEAFACGEETCDGSYAEGAVRLRK